MKDAISWFKKTVTGENLYSNEGYKDFEVALLMAKKEVFDDIDCISFINSFPRRVDIKDLENYKKIKQRHLSTSTLEEHEKDCSCCKSINEKGKAESKEAQTSVQSTPQIMAADDILQLAEDNANKDAYELNGTFYANFLKQKFIQLSSVESALKEIDENSLKTEKEIFDLVWDLVPETDDYERLEVEQDLIKRAIYETIYLINQIITKNFKNIGVEVE